MPSITININHEENESMSLIHIPSNAYPEGEFFCLCLTLDTEILIQVSQARFLANLILSNLPAIENVENEKKD